MGLFGGKSCIALTWAADGRCWGVHLTRDGDRFQVEEFWRGEAGGTASVAARLTRGLDALGHDESTRIACGGSGTTCGFVDLDMPRLTGEDLRSALAFELNRCAPIAADKLVWGYRLLHGPAGQDGQQRVRLIYMRESEWVRWVDTVSALGSGVDVLMPPIMTLDPLLAGVGLFVPCNGDADGLLFRSNAQGGRDVVRTATVEEGTVGALPSPLRVPGLVPGELEKIPAAEQRDFAPAVLLAMYGLSRSADADRATWVPVPLALRPTRNRYSRTVATCLVAYLLAVAVFMLAREYRSAAAYLGDLHSECARIEQKIAKYEAGDSQKEFLATLQKEMNDAYTPRPSMVEVLSELTQLVDKEAWLQNFNWTDGQVELQLSSVNDALDIRGKLEDSPILGDVVPGQKTLGHNNVMVLRLQMNARYDVKGEGPKEKPASTKARDEEDSEKDSEKDSGKEEPKTPDPEKAGEKVDVPPPPPPPGGETRASGDAAEKEE